MIMTITKHYKIAKNQRSCDTSQPSWSSHKKILLPWEPSLNVIEWHVEDLCHSLQKDTHQFLAQQIREGHGTTKDLVRTQMVPSNDFL